MTFLSLSREKVQKNKKNIFEYLLITRPFICIISFNQHYKPIRERDPICYPTPAGTIHIEYNDKRAYSLHRVVQCDTLN